MTASIQAVIFDMDGVLILSSDLHYYAFRKAFKSEGVEFTRPHYEDVGVGTARDVVVRTVLGDDLPRDQFERVMAAKERHVYEYLDKEGLDAVPGSLELVRRVRSTGLRTAVATASRTPRPFLKAIGASDLFEVVIDRSDVEHPKPDPEIYLLTASRLGIEPDACIVVEDSPAGVESAVAAGMRVVAVTTTHSREVLGEATWVYDRFEEIDLDRVTGMPSRRS